MCAGAVVIENNEQRIRFSPHQRTNKKIGRPGLCNGASGAVAVVIVDIVQDPNAGVEYMGYTVILAGYLRACACVCVCVRVCVRVRVRACACVSVSVSVSVFVSVSGVAGGRGVCVYARV